MGCRYTLNAKKRKMDHELLCDIKSVKTAKIRVPKTINLAANFSDSECATKCSQSSNKMSIKVDKFSFPILKKCLSYDFTEITPSTFLIICRDYRLIEDIDFLMRNKGNTNYEHLFVAGASLGLVQTKFKYWGQSILDHIEIGININELRRVIVIDHLDCSTYKNLMPYNNKDEELQNHKDCLQKSFGILSQRFPNLEFEAYLMDLHGDAEFIEIDKTISNFDPNIADSARSELLSKFIN